MNARILLFILFALCGKSVFAQTGWRGYDTLYSNNNITVELDIYYSNNSCTDGGKTFKYKYRLNGYISQTTQYVNWKMDYVNCNGELYYEQRSIAIGGYRALKSYGAAKLIDHVDYDPLVAKFIALSVEAAHYDVAFSTTSSTGSGKQTMPLSTDPVEIEGVKTIYKGQSAKLNVKGGSLGTAAEWVWYKKQCGGDRIGTGRSIEVTPDDTTTYFVRAVGKNNTTNCAEATVTVDMRSTPPTGISAETKVCKGDNTTLTVEGGSLGLGAEWVWYKNQCGTDRIGAGKIISVQPKENTTYFVRAEGTLNNSDCAFLKINVYERSLDPNSIVPTGPTTICEGEKINLKVSGGLISNGADWKWYSRTCDGTYVASGSTVELTPQSSTTYYVKGVGYCNTTNCVSIEVTVNNKSANTGLISKPTEIFKRKKATLSVSGGSLGNGAEWQWYNGSCSAEKLIGTGSSITISTRKPTKYFVKAKGLCNETNCIEALVTPVKMHHWSRIYGNKYKKIIEIGYGIGVESIQNSGQGLYKTFSNGTTSTIDTVTIPLNGLGIKGEFPFYPFMKNNISIGFITAYSIGVGSSFLSSNKTISSDTKSKEAYSYQRFQLETELAFGFKKFKFLIKLKRAFQSNDYSKTITTHTTKTSEYLFTHDINKEMISGGIRLGSYSGKYNSSRGNSIDFLYTLRRDVAPNLIAFSGKDYGMLSKWKVGGAFSWWRQSRIKMQIDVNLLTINEEFNINSIDFKGATYQFTFIINKNWFY